MHNRLATRNHSAITRHDARERALLDYGFFAALANCYEQGEPPFVFATDDQAGYLVWLEWYNGLAAVCNAVQRAENRLRTLRIPQSEWSQV